MILLIISEVLYVFFADDTSLALSACNIPDIESILNHHLRIISRWAKQWLVNFNPNKMKALFFTLENITNLPNLVFEGVPVC